MQKETWNVADQKVLFALEQGVASASEVSDLCKRSESMVRRTLAKLVQRGAARVCNENPRQWKSLRRVGGYGECDRLSCSRNELTHET